MNNTYYYVSTLLLFGLEATLAILVEDVTTVFDLVAAIAVTCLAFLFPAFFYIYAEKKYGGPKQKTSWRKCAYFHVILGFTAFSLCMFSNIYGFIN
jgi:amino acid transporter